MTKTAPQYSLSQPNKSNLPFFSRVNVLCEKRDFSGFQIKIKPLSHTGAKKIQSILIALKSTFII